MIPDDAPDGYPISIVHYDADSGDVLAHDTRTVAALYKMTVTAGEGRKTVPGHDLGEPLTGWFQNRADRPTPLFPEEVAWIIFQNDDIRVLLETGPFDIVAMTAISHEDGLDCAIDPSSISDETMSTFMERTRLIFKHLESQEDKIGCPKTDRVKNA